MPVRVTGSVLHHDWGDPSFLPALLGRPPDGRPWAEWWLGTHHAAPSTTSNGVPLAEVSGELGFLVKVLACDAPLSLQAHPDPVQARAGWEAEESRGLPLDDLRRNYRDPSAKPEILIALTGFEALCGFDGTDRALARLRSYGWHDEADVLSGSPTATYLEWALGAGPPPDAATCPPWLAGIARRYPSDPALRIAPLLNHVVLSPGEAIVLPAGNLHAYLRGAGLEVMGPSDNVVRAGFTSKHVDRTEVLRIVDTSVLASPVSAPRDGTYLGPGGELRVSRIDLDGTAVIEAPSTTVVVRTAGSLDGTEGDEAIVILAGETVEVSGRATLWACRNG